MNFTKNTILLGKNLGVGIFECSRLSISAVWHRQLVKFNQFITNFSLRFQIGQDIRKDSRQLFAANTPHKLISHIGPGPRSLYKRNGSPKATNQPRENWKFSVITDQLNLIKSIGLRFVSIVLKCKATLRVDPSRQIGVIYGGWRGGHYERLNHFLRGMINQSVVSFKAPNSVNCNVLVTLNKRGNQGHGLVFLLYKKRKDHLCKLNGLGTLNGKLAHTSMSFGLLNLIERTCSSESVRKPLNNFRVYGCDKNGSSIFESIGVFNLGFSKEKASVSINISSGVSQGMVISHT